jgi:hypothetical protein
VSRDVLIRAGANEIAHKWSTNVPADHDCYWTVNGTPRQTEPGQYVWFVSPTLARIYAYSEIVALEDGKLWFRPLKEVDLEAPKEPPTRGFTYCDPLLENIEWINEGELA